MFDMYELASNLPESSIFFEYSHHGMLLSGLPGVVNCLKLQFWTPAGFCDLELQGDLCTKTILVTPKFQR